MHFVVRVSEDGKCSAGLVNYARPHTDQVCGLAWDDRGQWLAAGTNGNDVDVFDYRAGLSHVYVGTKGHEAAVKALGWCPWRRGLLATGGGQADRCVKFWQVPETSPSPTSSLLPIAVLDVGAQVTAIVWSTRYRECCIALGYVPTLNPTTTANAHHRKSTVDPNTTKLAVYTYPGLHPVLAIKSDPAGGRILHAVRGLGGDVVVGTATQLLKLYNLWDWDRRLHYPGIRLGGGRITPDDVHHQLNIDTHFQDSTAIHQGSIIR
ncbi:hypothetical protein PYCC9005_004311 [Savitreella phatthalungensis]